MGYIEQVLQKRGKLGIFSESEIQEFDELIMPVDTNININSVILSDENKEKIQDFLKEQKYKEKLVRHKLYPMNRILMYGASGTGKTYLTKALSNYMGYTMLYVDIAKSLSEGTVARNISNIFKLANALENCVVFFDEADSIAWNRDSSTPDSGVLRRATNSLFQQLDQMSYNNVFVSATNLLFRIDPAFERRFDIKMEFRRPKNIEDAIQKFLFKEFSLLDDVHEDRKSIIIKRAEASPKLSYYEIQCIVERAMKKAIMNNTMNVMSSWIYDDIARTERIKMYFKTDKDDDETFKSSIK